MTKLQIIFDAVSSKTGLKIEARNRHKDFIISRLIYYKLGVEFSGCCLGEVADYIGRNRVTALSALEGFEDDILNKTDNLKTYNDLREYCSIRMPLDKKHIIYKHSIVHHNINLKQQIQELKDKIENPPKATRVLVKKNKRPLVDKIEELTDLQYNDFEQRTEVALKFVKTIRTYENTHKREFNAA